VAQDALLLAFRHRHSFRGDALFTTWLYRVAASAALMHLRWVRRRSLATSTSLNDERAPLGLCAVQPSPEELMSSGETVALCERIAAEMGTKYAPIFRLRFVEGCSHAEIAQELGLDLSTVKARTHRVLARVKRRLGEEATALGLRRQPARLLLANRG
jgi:RNA polymerase sigma-70 factor (ECF subfamily)